MIRHYRKLGVYQGWSIDRVNKCARLIGESYEELAASCCIPFARMKFWISRGFFPGYAALLFYMREQDFLNARGLKD